MRGVRPAVRRLLIAVACAALASGALAGCATLTAPRYHGPPSDHFDGKHFHNYVRFKDRQINDAIRREVHAITGRRGHWDRWQDVATDVPPARVGGGALRVSFVNHSTVLIQMDSINILTDPVWSGRISPVRWYGPKRHRPPGIQIDDLPPIDVIVISHNHYDHMDLPTLRTLVARFHPRIITGLGNAKYLATQGVPAAEDIDWWQSVALRAGSRITGVPAQHWSARGLTDKWRTLWLGFVIEGPSGAVYFAGDTGYGEFFPLIRDRFSRFRLAILPIAPARPRSAMAPRHMSAGDAVRAARLFGATTNMAMHFGTFQQGDDGEEEPVDSLRAALAAAGACAPRFWALRNGEARLVPAADTTARSATTCTPGNADRSATPEVERATPLTATATRRSATTPAG
ncbi:MAG: MBL fold metallo-hydrolase [Gemmatimonadaceae bacterium]